MSLINQMLQDLAQRQAPSNNAPSLIRPLALPLERKKIPVRIWLISITLVNIAVVAWLLHHSNAQPVPQRLVTTAIVQPVKFAASHVMPPKRLTHPHTRNRLPPAVMAQASVVANATAIVAPPAISKPDPAPASGNIPAAGASTATFPAAPAAAVAKDTPAAPATTPASAVSAGISASPANTTSPDSPADSSIAIRKQARRLTPAQIAQNDYVQAVALAQQGDMAGAIAGFSQVLSLEPNHHQARLMLAGLLIESKRFNEAENDLQTGLTQDPAQIDFATLLARLQIEHGDLGASIATLTHSLPYAGNQADYQAFLAALLQRSGKNDQAIDHYVIALKQNPQSGLWWMGLGISEKAAGRIAEANEAFARAKATNSLSPDLQAYVEQQLHQQ